MPFLIPSRSSIKMLIYISGNRIQLVQVILHLLIIAEIPHVIRQTHMKSGI